jgi:hypothetical protein
MTQIPNNLVSVGDKHYNFTNLFKHLPKKNTNSALFMHDLLSKTSIPANTNPIAPSALPQTTP